MWLLLYKAGKSKKQTTIKSSLSCLPLETFLALADCPPQAAPPAFPRPQPSPICGYGTVISGTGISVVEDTEEQLSCINFKNTRVFKF